MITRLEQIDHNPLTKPRRIKMKATPINDIDTVSISDFANIILSHILLVEGTVVFDNVCKTDAVADVVLDGTNINHYLPREKWCSDGSVNVEDLANDNFLELLRASQGKKVTIYNRNGDVVGFTIGEKNVRFTSYECV